MNLLTLTAPPEPAWEPDQGWRGDQLRCRRGHLPVLGRHATAAGHKVCRRHHPDGHLTAESVRQAHHLYLGSKPGKG